ncbi:MAG: AAA family ATPase [Candidatus Aceula meridiana]|nr:AAA family ATPase [Candidatus Aceula meridiana]
MYLKRIEIFGFKSFADKTVLNFEPGITAVVGPNGCGKSNVFDAIRWVLGEQSMKELRGSTKEDVIFNGTSKRPALNFAEVSLTFSNENKVFPIEYDEVTVSRRVYRSGESEYLLNKTQVRLKDILELFMGTGIGAEAYSLVQQGRVDLIVSARPDDRRLIFDEAAGITKYKAKKREALNKLKDTDNNLLRSNDIILEVKKQIASIERQAKKAQRYKEEYERLKIMEFIFAEDQIANLDKNRTDLESALSEFGQQEQALHDDLTRLNQVLSDENKLIAELDQKENELHQEDIKLENQIEMENRQINFNEERITTIDSNEERIKEQKNKLTEQCHSQEGKITNLREAFDLLRQEVVKNTEQLASQRLCLQELESQIQLTKNAIRQEEEEIFQLSTSQVNFKNEVTEIMKDFQGALARKRRLDLENDKVINEKQEIDIKLEVVNQDISRCLEEINRLRSEKNTKDGSLNETKHQLADLAQTITTLENTILGLKSKREFIEEMRVQYENTTDPISSGRFITRMPPPDGIQGMIGRIKEVTKLEGERRRALDGRFTDNPNEELYEIVCETKFIELDPEQITAKIDALAEQVTYKNEEKRNILIKIAEQESDINRLGILVHDKEKEMSGFVADKNNVLEVVSKLADELTLITQEIVETKEVLADLKANEDELNERLASVNEKIESFKGTINQQQSDIVAKTQNREGILIEVTQLETELESSKEQEEGQQENLRLFEGSLITTRQELDRIERESQESHVKRQEYLKSNEQIHLKIEDLKIKRDELKICLNNYEQQKQEVYTRIQELRPRIGEVEKGLEAVKEQSHNQALKRQELSFGEQSVKDKLLQTYKIDFDEFARPEEEGSIESLEVFDFSTLNPDQDQELIQQEKEKIAFKELKERLVTIRPEIQTEGLEDEVERLKKRCDSYGSVNLVAIDEHEELKQRFEFLTKQQTDLLEAKQSLMNAITKINRTTRQLFVDTFTKVSEEFRIYFRMLFGGGEADLILVDPENVLESGIDIVAKPPGKKLQNITLLSGGEKTMAAIALIFAVFKVRPSPFCVLDEIDAALDESNVGRYSYLLQEFSKIAQFIVITHNKKTISAADVMYGITMQERGVSKIVSVKLSEDQEEVGSREKIPAAV